MPIRQGIEIEHVNACSAAAKAGLRPGDVLISANSHRLRDAIDFMYQLGSAKLDIEFIRNSERQGVEITLSEGEDHGLTFSPFSVKTCRNNCIFCFVKQLPKGLRRSLYIKDEDYRLSFLYGNYMTLSNISIDEKKRIVEQRLSPIYVSVHSTDKEIRNLMLGNPKAADIIKELKYFADNKIRMHTQIVLCPGYNDGKHLSATIRDLYRFYPYVSSIAVVPVGLTMHRLKQLEPVNSDGALKAIETVEAYQKRFRKKHGDPIVYCSDELYIKAGRPFPNLSDYGSLPQIENGVGMVPLFLSQARKIRPSESGLLRKKFITFTGVSFYPFLKKFIDRLCEKSGVDLDVLQVKNNFFGTSVTVAGLLTGRDVIESLSAHRNSHDVVLVPDVCLKEDEEVFLDDKSLVDLEKATGLKAVRIESTPQGLIRALTGGH